MNVGHLVTDARSAYDERSALLLVRARQVGHGIHNLDTSISIDVDAIRILLPV